MDIKNTGMQSFQNLRFNNAGGRAAVQSAKPTQDKVIDLTQASTAAAELNTSDAQFVRVKADKKEFFFDLSQMAPEQRQALVSDLKAKVGTALDRKQFDPEKFFDLTSNNTLEYAVKSENFATLSADVLDAQGILDKSMTDSKQPQLNREVFAVMNGDYKTQASEGVQARFALTKADVPPEARVGEQKKPSEWYNGLQVKKGADGQYDVSLYLRDKTQEVAESVQQMDVAGYQQMVKNDFNFQGAVRFIQNKAKASLPAGSTPEAITAKAESMFMEAVGQKFSGGHPSLNAEQLKTVSQHIWSYATTGADTDGSIDIARLQGMMRVLDPEIQNSGNNNGSGAAFTLDGPGGKVQLRAGDEFHGRSTILQTRHLMADLLTQSSQLTFSSQPDKIPGLTGYDQSLVLVDNSSSMGDDTQFLAQILKASALDGQVAVGTFIDKADHMEWSDKAGAESTSGPVFMKASESITLLDQQGKLHNQAYANGSTQAPGSAFEIEANNKQRQSASGDVVINNRVVSATWEESRMRESGLTAGIQALQKMPDVPPAVDGKNHKQLVLVTDETDAAPERLASLQKLAQKKGFDVKLMIINTQGQSVRMVNVSQVTDQQRKDATQDTVKKVGDGFSAGGNGRFMMDWNKIADAQSAQTYNWYIPQQ